MFKLEQIITPTQLIRRFHKVLKELESTPQPILITQRNGSHMVLVNAEIFEDLVNERLTHDGVALHRSHLKERILSPSL